MAIAYPVRQASQAWIFGIALIAAAGSFIFGFDMVIMSGAILFMEDELGLSSHAKGFAMTSAGWGVLAGFLVAGFTSDRIGRKTTMILASVLFGISALGTAFPETLINWSLWFEIASIKAGSTDLYIDWNIYRILGGIGGGMAILVAPMYIAEMAPARKRGRLVMMYQLAQVLGAAISNITAYYFARMAEADASFSAWRWMFGIEIVPVIGFLVGLHFIPRSPRWLAEKGEMNKATEILTMIDGPEYARNEISEIRKTLDQENGRFSELFAPGVRVAFLIAAGLCVFQQAGGVSTIIFYAPDIFEEAGIALKSESLKQTIILVLWNLACTIAALFLVDRAGRRPMLVWGALGMAAGQALVAISFQYGLSSQFLLFSMFVAIGAYILTLAPLTHVVISEIYPTRIRARGLMAAMLFHSFSGQTVNHTFPSMREKFIETYGHPAGSFWIFTGICLLAFIFNYKMVPETKKKTLEEISAFWISGRRRSGT